MGNFSLSDFRQCDRDQLDRAMKAAVLLLEQGLADEADNLLRMTFFALHRRYYYAGQKYGWLRFPDKEGAA